MIPAATDPQRARQAFGLSRPFVLYVGRIDENKGCAELFDYFQRYLESSRRDLDLVLIGTPAMPIPSHPRIRHLGFVSDQDKFDVLAAADALVMPSYFESLSMVALEAWALGRPVLANGQCDVLQGQCLRSNAGLYYENAGDFAAALDRLLDDAGAGGRDGAQRPRVFRAALQLAGDRAEVSRHVRPAGVGARGDARWNRCPAGSPGVVRRCRRRSTCWRVCRPARPVSTSPRSEVPA